MMELNFASDSVVTRQGYNITYRVQVPTNEGMNVFIKRFCLNKLLFEMLHNNLYSFVRKKFNSQSNFEALWH